MGEELAEKNLQETNKNRDEIKKNTALMIQLEEELKNTINVASLNDRIFAREEAVKEMLTEQTATEELIRQMNSFIGTFQGARLTKADINFLSSQVHAFTGVKQGEKTKYFFRSHCKPKEEEKRILIKSQLKMCSGL